MSRGVTRGLATAATIVTLSAGMLGLTAPLASGAGSPQAVADTAVPVRTIRACYNKRTGALRVTNGKCRRGERRLTWNSDGPVGPIGPTGATGPAGPAGPATLTTAFARTTATDGIDAAAARTAAPEVALVTRGQLSFYGKCFRNSTANVTYAEIYLRTTANGAVFDGSTDELGGGPLVTDFLNTDTAEVDRTIDDIGLGANTAGLDEGEYTAMAADGAQIVGQTTVAVKNGTLAGGNGAYGEGNVCMFGITMAHTAS